MNKGTKLLFIASFWLFFVAGGFFWSNGLTGYVSEEARFFAGSPRATVGGWLVIAINVFVFSFLLFILTVRKRVKEVETAVKRELTQEEKEQLERDAIRAAEEREIQMLVNKEVSALKNIIPLYLNVHTSQFAVASYHPDGKARKRAQKRISAIKFDWIGMDRTNVWFRLNGMSIQRAGMRFPDLKKESNGVIENLQYGINRPCTFYEDDNFNLYVRVFLKTGIQGIPKVYLWEDAFDKLPKTKKFAVPVGVNEFNKAYYQDLTAWPHGLILGATGMGKSTFIKHSIITLALRTMPHELELWLVDFKRVEFGMFKELPHAKEFINSVDEFLPLMDKLIKEMDRRMKKFEGVCSELYEWNIARPGEQMPVIMCWIDEIALITRGGDSKLASEAITKILRLVALGRAFGIHMIMGTQTISKEVLPMDITANVDGRVVFGVPNSSASTLAIGDARAVGLKPAGRCVFRKESDLMFLQTPIMHPDKVVARKMLLEQVERAIERCKKPDFDDMQLFRLARTMGTASYRELVNHPACPWSEHQVRETLSHWKSNGEVKKIVLDTEELVLVDTGRGTGKGLHLIPHDEYILKGAVEVAEQTDQVAVEVDGVAVHAVVE